MQALSWVVVKPAPRDFIENFVGASDFWGNKVCMYTHSMWWSAGLFVGGDGVGEGKRRRASMRTPIDHTPPLSATPYAHANQVRIQHKKTGPQHVAFVDAYKALILGLMAYVKEHHTTGVAWNNAVSGWVGWVGALCWLDVWLVGRWLVCSPSLCMCVRLVISPTPRPFPSRQTKSI